MKRLMGTLVLALAMFIVGAVPALAFQEHTGTTVLIGPGQTVNDDVFAAGNDITVAGHITGDLYAFGQTITLTSGSRIDGDIIGAAQTITIGGTVGDSVRAAAQSVQVLPDAHIGGGLVTAAQNTIMGGVVARGLATASQQLQITGQVGKEVRAGVATLTILPTARIAGDLIYSSSAQSSIPQGTVGGQVHYIAPTQQTPQAPANGSGIGHIFGLLWFLGNVIAGLLLVSLVPRLRDASRVEILGRPWATFGVGVITLVVLPILAAVLLITVIGIPLSLIGIGGYIAFLYLGWLLTGYALGYLILRVVTERGRWSLPSVAAWPFLIGFIVLTLLRLIPFVGLLTALIGGCFGLGSLVLALYRSSSSAARSIHIEGTHHVA
jgi:cytoskeletal protein CcmA (bactofilin family)